MVHTVENEDRDKYFAVIAAKTEDGDALQWSCVCGERNAAGEPCRICGRRIVEEALTKVENDRNLWTPEWQEWQVDAGAWLAAAPAPPAVGGTGNVRALVTAVNAVLAANPHDDTMWSLDAAVTPFNASKPEECVNGCPTEQVCDYCQVASIHATGSLGMEVAPKNGDMAEALARRVREALGNANDPDVPVCELVRRLSAAPIAGRLR